MRRTRLFHTVVIVGSTLLASCEKGPKPVAKKDAAVVKDAPAIPLIDAPAPRIMALIDAGDLPPPPRIMPPPPRIQAAPPHPRIQVKGPKRFD